MGAAGLALAACMIVVGPATVRAVVPGESLASGTACPDEPVRLEDVIALDVDAGPLTQAYRPVYGNYQENAAACFGSRRLRLTGFVAGPDGLGGAREWAVEPTWIGSPGHFLSASHEQDPDGLYRGPFLMVASMPAMEGGFAGAAHRWVTVEGQYHHPASETCTTSGDPSVAPSAAEAIAICETSFVVTGLAEVNGPPETDTDASFSPSTADAADASAATILLMVIGVMGGLLWLAHGRARRVSR